LTLCRLKKRGGERGREREREGKRGREREREGERGRERKRGRFRNQNDVLFIFLRIVLSNRSSFVKDYSRKQIEKTKFRSNSAENVFNFTQ
jgi:hypothetical protein